MAEFRISLKAARVNAELSQAEAAKALGISRPTLQSWETGKTEPKQSQVVAICGLYKVPQDALSMPVILAKS